MSAGMTFLFSSMGRAKKACASLLRPEMTLAGTPCPVMVKKPISVQVRSISRPVRSRAVASPLNALLRSMTGICVFIACLSAVCSRACSMVIGASVDDDGLPGDEGGVRSRQEGDGTDEVGRRHLARQHARARRRLAHALHQRRILEHAVAQREPRRHAV